MYFIFFYINVCYLTFYFIHLMYHGVGYLINTYIKSVELWYLLIQSFIILRAITYMTYIHSPTPSPPPPLAQKRSRTAVHTHAI